MAKEKRNEVYVRKVTGNPFKFLSQKQNLKTAIEESRFNDIIKIGSSSFDLKDEEIVISHKLDIQGSNTPKPSIIIGNMRKNIGFLVQNGEEIVFKNINILNKDDTIGIYVNQMFTGNFVLENVVTEKPFISNFDIYQPLISYEGSGELIIRKSNIHSIEVNAPNAKVTIIDSVLGTPTTASHIVAREIMISNSKINQVKFSPIEQTYIYDSVIEDYIEIEGAAFIKNVELGKNPKIIIKEQPYMYFLPNSKATIEDINTDSIEKSLFYINNAIVWISGYDHMTFYEPIKSKNGTINQEDITQIPVENV